MIDSIINSFDIWTDAQGLKSKGRVKSIENISLEGIAALRELILELAVRGKLVAQDSNDEPANLLIKKIAKLKEQLTKEGKIKKQPKLSDISDNEIPFKLPKNWVWTRLGNLGIGYTGSTPKTTIQEFFNGDIPFIGPGQIISNGTITAPDTYLTEKGIKYSTIANPDDIVMVCIGGSIGKSAIVKSKITFNQQLNSISPLLIKTTYLYIAMRSPLFLKSILEKATGSATPIINRTRWENIIVPIPPLAEQHRIVAKVEELMALCDKLEAEQTNNLKTHQLLVKTLLETLTQASNAEDLQAAWQRMAMHFDTLFCTEDSIEQLKQTILQLAVMGKLVKQNPEDEPATELLKKIAKEKEKLIKEGTIKKQTPLPEIKDEEKPFVIPKSWKWIPWGNILAYDNYPFKRGPFGSSLKKDMFIESGYKVYEQYCPINDDCSFERYYISDELFKILEGFAVKENDYLISCSGATLGRITQVPSNFKEGIINQALLRVRINHEYVDKDFFKLLFRSPYFQKMIFDNSSGSAIPNVKGVNELKIMPIPFQPLGEQHRIVAKVEELFALCDTLKEKIIKSQEIKGLLAKTVIASALPVIESELPVIASEAKQSESINSNHQKQSEPPKAFNQH